MRMPAHKHSCPQKGAFGNPAGFVSRGCVRLATGLPLSLTLGGRVASRDHYRPKDDIFGAPLSIGLRKRDGYNAWR
jgi:hypothetical protein